MNEFWNLNPIYRDFSDPRFSQDLDELKTAIDAFAAMDLHSGQAREILRRGILLQEQINDLAGKLAIYCSLTQAADTRNTQAGSQLGRVMALLSGYAAPEAAFQNWVAALPDLKELISGDELLESYAYLFDNMVTNSQYLLSGKGEEIMARMQLSGGNAWGDLQQFLTSTVPVSYRGETTNLSAIRNLAYDADAAVRKEAFEAELACYDRIRDSVAFALNSIKLETLSDCALRGYESPLARTLCQSHMKRETLDAMLEAMKEYLPKFRQYLKAKAAALGHKNGLPWYDLFAPMGATSTRFTAQSARDYLVNLFAGFDSELSEMVATAFDNAWIDFYPRNGKSGGAFCAEVACLGESRVLTNFDGQFGDVVTLAHELGHAFHNHCIRSHRPLNHDYSMPVAETASTFNECVVMAAAIEGCADKAEKLALIESQLQDATQIIVDIYSRYLFETSVFESREQEFMDADALCERMLTAQKESYGDGLDPEAMHPYMWICKSHYYGPTFYNFPYAFGGLFARGLYAQYQTEGAAFLPKYKKLLYTTTVADAEQTAAVAGIDLTNKNFWRSALDTIAQQIDLFCQLVQH